MIVTVNCVFGTCIYLMSFYASLSYTEHTDFAFILRMNFNSIDNTFHSLNDVNLNQHGAYHIMRRCNFNLHKNKFTVNCEIMKATNIRHYHLYHS